MKYKTLSFSISNPVLIYLILIISNGYITHYNNIKHKIIIIKKLKDFKNFKITNGIFTYVNMKHKLSTFSL